MKTIAEALRRMTHIMPAAIASFVMSESFLKACEVVERDATVRAYLLRQALAAIALDPLVGRDVNAFVLWTGRGHLFNLYFDRWSNFIGLVELPPGPEADALLAAVETNLQSPMFKAARMSRRMDYRAIRLLQQAARKADRAYDAKMAVSGAPSTFSAHEKALEAANELYERRVEQVRARQRRVSQAASPGFPGGFSDSVAAFLYAHLPIYGNGAHRQVAVQA